MAKLNADLLDDLTIKAAKPKPHTIMLSKQALVALKQLKVYIQGIASFYLLVD